MTLLLIVLVALCFWKIEFCGYHSGFLSAINTLPIKGIFTFLVLFQHVRDYITLSDTWINSVYLTVQDHLGQLIVAMFLFYSGFGVWESFKKKKQYEQTFFKHRILRTLLHFDIIVLLFIIIQLLLHNIRTPNEYLFCWIGWESVGNSNWYVFDILMLYLCANVSMVFQKKYGRGGICITILSTALLWVLLRFSGKHEYWVNTLAAFPLGMLFCSQKDKLYTVLSQKRMPYYLTALFGLLLILSFKKGYILSNMGGGVDVYGCTTCIFCILVVLISSWIRIGNPILNWAGRNVFTIYILQRLPMIVFAAMGINAKPWLFITLSFIATFVLAELFSRVFKKLDKKLFDA